MSGPRNIEELFNRIDAKVHEGDYYFAEPPERKKFVEAELRKASTQFTNLRGGDVTYQNYVQYQALREYHDIQPTKATQPQPTPTSADFWKAAYAYDPIQSEYHKNTDLDRILATKKLKYAAIGRMWGKIQLRLWLLIHIHPLAELPDDCPSDFTTDCYNAISYPDGHPSTANLSTTRIPPTIHPAEDTTLRRFTSLGFVEMQESPGSWTRTGHVLVMDMDDKAIRHRQPWLVLSPEWPRDADDVIDDADGGDTFYASSKVRRNHHTEPGVFPGDKNRTSICSIRARDHSDQDHIPVLLRLGHNFDFEPVRFGSSSHYVKQSKYGPDLARGMLWCLDQDTNQEVCYDANDQEYMRYDVRTGRYHYPNLHRTSFAGEQGMFGELVDASTVETAKVSLLAPLTPPREHTGHEF
ncbi:MAG: hypothetical protein Q9197_005891 [Variospora fuerteventurae]